MMLMILMRRLLAAAFLIYATLLLAACASMDPKLQAPSLTLVGASMLSADMFNQQFHVRIHVQNPNARELPIKSIDYKLFLEGDFFAEGVSEAPFTVPANGEKEFDLTVKTNFVSSIGRLLSRITNKNAIQYTFTGHIALDKTFSPKIGFAENGSVDLGRK